MAKCWKCGKKGLFFKVNDEGLCSKCATIVKFEKEKSDLEDCISNLENKISKETEKLEQLRNERQKEYDAIKRQAEHDAVADVEESVSKLKKQEKQYKDKAAVAKEEYKKSKADSEAITKKYIKMKTLFESFQSANKKYVKEGERKLDESFLKKLSPAIEIELQCMNVKQLRGLYTQNKKLIQDCLKRYEDRYTTKSNIAIYKLMVIALEAELQNILSSLRYGKLEQSIDAVQQMSEKYLLISTDGNQTIAPTVKKFIGEIEHLFIEAVKIEYEYYVQKERIKEEQRAIREQMRQEAEERKALELEKKRIATEEKKFQNEIDSIKQQMENATSEKMELLLARIKELENQLDAISDKREQIAALENGKAGYVYIISNIGSFGDDVYKIGMTRRLDPMERVHELGSASVPFPFDVHGMIFSDDAVGLEHDLHLMFNNQRLNKVNLRKEFFKVSLDDIENAVSEAYPSAEFHKTALAEQYRQSLGLNESLSEIDAEDLQTS